MHLVVIQGWSHMLHAQQQQGTVSLMNRLSGRVLTSITAAVHTL
jgi:hypothetical protein